jgi:hypothetical protein
MWFRNLATFRARLAGQELATCEMCGSRAAIGGTLRGCDECRLRLPEDRLNDALMGRGWAIGVVGGERIAITRAGETPVSGPAEGLPRVRIGELVGLALMRPAARKALLDVRSVFPGAEVCECDEVRTACAESPLVTGDFGTPVESE